jgi:transcriptional regulator with PAS, ATPase and Fis domain
MKEAKNDRSGGDRNLISELEEKIERYARVPHYVLITGERGTGKTTIARKLHEQGARSSKEFVNLNCASLTSELLESELFGYEKGAFTGATQPKAGLFEIASGGTLFLDEIGEIPLGLQAKLLKAVEEKRIRRLGSTNERTIDARIVAATSQNLKRMVSDGRFRADLYDRLNILNLETIPLRHQKEKIKDLLLAQLNAERPAVGRKRPFEISDRALCVLESYDWKGNFRELLNFATHLAVECHNDTVITGVKARRVLCERINSNTPVKNSASLHATDDEDALDNLPPSPEDVVTVTFDPKTEDLDAIYLKAAGSVIQHVLSDNAGNLRRAATALGATHSTISRIMKKFNQSRERQGFQPHPPTREQRTAAA